MEAILMAVIGSLLMFLYQKMVENEKEVAVLKEKVREMEEVDVVATEKKILGDR